MMTCCAFVYPANARRRCSFVICLGDFGMNVDTLLKRAIVAALVAASDESARAPDRDDTSSRRRIGLSAERSILRYVIDPAITATAAKTATRASMTFGAIMRQYSTLTTRLMITVPISCRTAAAIIIWMPTGSPNIVARCSGLVLI